MSNSSDVCVYKTPLRPAQDSKSKGSHPTQNAYCKNSNLTSVLEYGAVSIHSGWHLWGECCFHLQPFTDQHCIIQKSSTFMMLIVFLSFSKKELRQYFQKCQALSAKCSYYYYYYYYWYSALGPVWAETRVQSGDWYSSGTLHPGQVLRGSLPLLSPAF